MCSVFFVPPWFVTRKDDVASTGVSRQNTIRNPSCTIRGWYAMPMF